MTAIRTLAKQSCVKRAVTRSSTIVTLLNTIRDDTDTIKFTHQSDLAANRFRRDHIYIGRDTNRLAETKVAQEKVCISTELTWVRMEKSSVGLVVVESWDHNY